MRTVTKPEEKYFDDLRRAGDEPLKTALDDLGTLSHENCVDYMALVYECGPTVGQDLLDGRVDHPKRDTYLKWWEETLEIGRKVLATHYRGSAVVNWSGPIDGTFGAALPSFPINELSRTRSLFQQYGREIGSALLLAALPQAYATSWGARVLAATGHLQNNSPGDLTRRIRATAQFVTFVLGPTGFVKEGDAGNGKVENAWDARQGQGQPANLGVAFRSVMGLRLLHQIIRTILTEPPDDAPKNALRAATKAVEEAKKAWEAQAKNAGEEPQKAEYEEAKRTYEEAKKTYEVAKKTYDDAKKAYVEAMKPVLGDENCEPNEPLNQEDLLATQLLFCVTVFEVLEKFGLSWSEEDQIAYLTTWTMIGRLLGVVAWDPSQFPEVAQWPQLNPDSVEGARQLLELLRIRQWKPVPPFVAEIAVSAGSSGPLDEIWNSLRPGRRLTKALLDELASAMGNRTRSWPLATMRELAPHVVRDRLGLGAGGLTMSVLDMLPHRTATIGWFTKIRLPNMAQAATLRFMANTVTRDAVISFLRSTDPPPFVLPGLEDWSATLPGVSPRSRARVP
jgi:ER-bound oxygenase mpaB/B'/Rubber oxygenase, catalytic domain